MRGLCSVLQGRHLRTGQLAAIKIMEVTEVGGEEGEVDKATEVLCPHRCILHSHVHTNPFPLLLPPPPPPPPLPPRMKRMRLNWRSKYSRSTRTTSTLQPTTGPSSKRDRSDKRTSFGWVQHTARACGECHVTIPDLPAAGDGVLRSRFSN